MDRQLISSGAPWERTVGYSRAVKVGPFISVAGTTAVDEHGTVIGAGDAHQQTIFIFEKIQKALQEAGATLEDVVRTRMFIINIDDWEAVGKAHGAFFKDIRPASTMLEVSRLINPDLLIEIEVDAIVRQ